MSTGKYVGSGLVKISYWLYEFLGRSESIVILGELRTWDDVYREYHAVLKAWNYGCFTTKRVRDISIERLKAVCMRMFDLATGKEHDWKYYDRYFLRNILYMIDSELKENIHFYPGQMVTRSEVKQTPIQTEDEEVEQLFALSAWLGSKKNKGT